MKFHTKFLFDLEQQFLSTDGRLNRKPFILYIVALFLFGLCLLIPSVITLVFMSTNDIQIFWLNTIVSALFDVAILFGLFLSIKRFHDLNKSALFVLLYGVPFINIIALVYLCCFKGTKGSNRYGQDLLAISDEQQAMEDKVICDTQNGLIARLEQKFFSTVGRIKRRQFIKYIGCLLGPVILIIVGISIYIVHSLDQFLAVINGADIPNLDFVQIAIIFVGSTVVGLCLLPLYYISIRRLHDFNFSAWWILIPHVLFPWGWIVFLVLLSCIPGSKTINRYGK